MTSASSPGFEASGAKSKVLIVDDNAQNRELLEAYLYEMPEVEPITASNGIEALERVAADRPAVILLDIMMPRMSGFEVCKRLKGDPRTRDIPVVVVTALDEMGDMERARECGADEFLSKPVNRVELSARVRSLLQVHQTKNPRERNAAARSTSPRLDAPGPEESL